MISKEQALKFFFFCFHLLVVILPSINNYHVYTRKNTDLLLGDFTNLHQHEIMIPKWQILGQSPRPQRLVTDRESRVAIPQQMSEPCEWTSEWTIQWPSTLHINFHLFSKSRAPLVVVAAVATVVRKRVKWFSMSGEAGLSEACPGPSEAGTGLSEPSSDL